MRWSVDPSGQGQPGASRNALEARQSGQWKLYLTAPAREGKANEACVGYLARQLGISRTRIRIKSGLAAREKRIEIEGVSEADWAAIVSRHHRGNR